MKMTIWCDTAILAGFLLCASANGASQMNLAPDTTAGLIAIANLDEQIERLQDTAGVEDLLLVRSRFLSDYQALERASRLTESRCATTQDFLQRARSRAAVHRFADALADVSEAERLGGTAQQILPLRSSILVATGHAEEIIPELEMEAAQHPSYASRSNLAGAYAALGRVKEADRLYVAALSDLHTTLPFPYAWIFFARGLLWAEQGSNPARAEIMYAQALQYLPQFVVAGINLAELEAARGDLTSAGDRLGRILAKQAEPEALALLGNLQVRTGREEEGRRNITRARQGYEGLLQRYPLAFADHAAEFYLGPGEDAERAWSLAKRNLANRHTDRAVALAIKAAQASGRWREAAALGNDASSSVQVYLRVFDQSLKHFRN